MKILPSRILASAVVATLASLAMVAAAAPAQALPTLTTVTINDKTYTYEDGNPAAGCTITAYSGTATSLWLPDGLSVYGVSYPLTAIGNSAFAEKGLTAVTIPNTVTLIDDYAFLNDSLTSITLPASLVTLGAWAFAGNHLTTVTIPDLVTSVGMAAFSNNLLTSVAFGPAVATIEIQAFYQNNLTSVTIPASVVTLGDNAFWGSPLATVTMQGSAPSTIGTTVFGLGGGATPVVSYYARNAGYTSPTWVADGSTYASRALVTVSWDAGMGGGVTVTDEAAGALAAPTAPTAEGHGFLGWSLTDGAGPVLDFPLAVSNDATLYALWEGRTVTSPAKADAGDSFAMTGSGFQPGETVEVWLHSDPVLLTTLTASGTGTLAASLLLPSGTPAGLHQLVFTGASTGTTSYDLTVEVVLAASGSDSGTLALVALGLALAGAGMIAASRRLAYNSA